jgi:cardiolipin synthase
LDSFHRLGQWLLVYSSLLLAACASNTIESLDNRRHAASSSGADLQLGSFTEPDQTANETRNSASLESGAGLFGKSLLVDPLLRPFSTLKALYGVTLKSAGGFIERNFISRLRFPRLERKPIPPIAQDEPMDLDEWERTLDELTSSPASSGRIRFLIDGDAYFTRLESAIDAAGESIDIRSYIFDNDDVGLAVAERLRGKSDEVEIRILVDGLADLIATRLDSPSMPDDAELPASISGYLTSRSKIEFRKQSNPWFTGDHAKITVVDSELAFLGGMNIGREYRYDWHDLMMEIDGPVVDRLQQEFDLAWAKAGMLGDLGWLAEALKDYPATGNTEGYPIRLLTTSIHNSELYRAQVAAIRRARSRIYIENAYFSDDKILFELARARRRGVDVRVILSAENDNSFLRLSNQTAVNAMLRNGIRVYSYPGMTHLKAAVYDGWACLGSANFDKLSLQINREINLGFSDPDTVNDLLEQVFYPDFDASTELRIPVELGARHHFAEMIADELL